MKKQKLKKTYQRKVSPLERMFIAIAHTDPPFCNTMILEGTGVIDESLWKKAIAEACEANPGSRLALKGRWAWAKWVDSGVAAPLRFVDGSNWSGYKSDGAPFLLDPFPFKTSHTSEVLVVKGNPTRLVFRSLHAIMDGTGTWMWALDIFRALQKEPLVGSSSTLNDKEFVASLNLSGKELPISKNHLTPTGLADGKARGFVWNRVTLEGKYSRLLPQFALAVAKEARKQGPGKIRIVVPLDLRKRVPDPDSTANLSRRIIIDIPPEATLDSIAQDVKDKLNNIPGDPMLASLFSYTPMSWMKRLFLSTREKDQQRGFFKDSGTISNGGKLPIESLHGGGFETKRMFWIPPQMETKPFFLSTVGYGNFLEVVTGMPKVLATNGRLDKFVSNIISELKQS